MTTLYQILVWGHIYKYIDNRYRLTKDSVVMQGVKDKRFFYSLGNVIDLSYHSSLCMPPRNDYTDAALALAIWWEFNFDLL